MDLFLPKANDSTQQEKIELNTNSIVIIGANGSGKSTLGAWIERNQHDKTHRIGAQRALTFGNYIQQKSYEQATNLLLSGTENSNNASHDNRWQWDGEQYGYTTAMLNDYEHVLSAIVALKVNQQEDFICECKKNDVLGQQHNCVPEMVIDILKKIWKSIFPHRDIDILDGKVVATIIKNDDAVSYKGKNMSDGERVALYLIAQSLCIPKNKIIIIDEPEIHLHRSIMNRLWNAIEKERNDCVFIYITHDTNFAASHKQAKKLWLKSFDGINWDYELVKQTQLPEQLLLDILGNRKPVIFVEGTVDSFDTKLYSDIYSAYYVVPCGSCSAVISQTKAMKNNPQLHDVRCFGIIDRDYRCDYEIERYKDDDIYTLKVAEVENLFLVEEVLDAVNSIMGFQSKENVTMVKEYVIKERFEKEINRQICESVVAELKYKLSTATISKKSEEEAKSTLQNLMKELEYESLKQCHEEKFNKSLESEDYAKVLEVFNSKSLSTSTGKFFDLNNKGYCDFIIRQLVTDKRNLIINAIIPYLPEEIML